MLLIYMFGNYFVDNIKGVNMKRIKYINFKAIIRDIISIFLNCAGISIIIIFFTGDDIFNKENFKYLTQLLFYLTLVFKFVFELSCKTNEWFNKPVFSETVKEHVIAPSGISKNAAEFNNNINAIHEAAHAVMASLCDIENFTVELSYANPRVVTLYKDGDADTVKKMILIKYAGAAAEELFFGSKHIGCMYGSDSDFESAAKLIKGYIVMTDSSISCSLLDSELNDKIIEYSKQFYVESYEIIKENKEKVKELSQVLLSNPLLDKDEVDKIVGKN